MAALAVTGARTARAQPVVTAAVPKVGALEAAAEKAAATEEVPAATKVVAACVVGLVATMAEA